MMKNKQDVLGLQNPKLLAKLENQGLMIGSARARELAEEMDAVSGEVLPLDDGNSYRAVEVLPALREKVVAVCQQNKVLLRSLSDLERNARSETLQRLVQYFRGNEKPVDPHGVIEKQYEYGLAAVEDFKHMVLAQHKHVLRLMQYGVEVSAVAQHIAERQSSLESRVGVERSLVNDVGTAVVKQSSDGRPAFLSREVKYQLDRHLTWHQGCVEDNALYLQQLSARRPLIERLIVECVHATRVSLRVYRESRDAVDYFYTIGATQIDRIFNGLAVAEIINMLSNIRESAIVVESKAVSGYQTLKSAKPPLPEREQHTRFDSGKIEYL